MNNTGNGFEITPMIFILSLNMFSSYQLKWYAILAGILTVSTLLVQQQNFGNAKIWDFFDYSFRISISLLLCWFINGYFILNEFKIFSLFTQHILGIVLGIAAVFVIAYLLYLALPQNNLNGVAIGFKSWIDIQKHVGAGFFVSIISYVVFYSVHTNSTLQNTKLEKQILEQSHLRAQILSLQQQISPHFLFNSLSTLKTIAVDQQTKNYVVQLASVYRYLLNFNERHLTPLEEEVRFIKSYIYIMNERFEESLVINMDIRKEDLSLLVPPLSLQLLIENAIKHNNFSPEQPLHINIVSSKFSLTVENNYQPKKFAPEGTGMGLKNIVERYKLLANRTINVEHGQKTFSVTLPLLQK
jgi:two-component system LytT family sensor kinase